MGNVARRDAATFRLVNKLPFNGKVACELLLTLIKSICDRTHEMATKQRDYYDVLGVPRDADKKAIQQAYHKLAVRYHPDQCKEPGATEKFKEIAEAYAILSDPEKRQLYDRHGFSGVSHFTPEDLFGGLDLGGIFGDRGFGFGDVFGRRRPAGPQKGANIQVRLDVSLERVFSGGEEKVHLRRPEQCSACEGSGAKAGTEPRTCDACNGTGQHVTQRNDRGVRFQQITTCTSCRGRGHLIDDPCPDCHGTGQVHREETLGVKIPPGISDGQALRIPGRGHPSAAPKGPPGDLLVVVVSKPDLRFERRGPHLWRVETIEVPDAVLGTKIDVPTLDGQATVTVPPGTQPESVMRLHDKGLPVPGMQQRGHLYITIRVHVPKTLNDEQRRLYEQLKVASSQVETVSTIESSSANSPGCLKHPGK